MKNKVTTLLLYMKQAFLSIKNFFLDFFVPIECVVCGFPSSYVCHKHRKFLVKHSSACFVCHTPTFDGGVCCDHMDNPCRGVLVGFYYTNMIQYLIHKAKYSGSFLIFDFFAEQIVYEVLTHPTLKNITQHDTVVSYIPMHPRKEHYIRGYNQSKILAEKVASMLSVNCISLCEKQKHTPAQATLSRKDRLTNITFVYNNQNIGNYKNIIVVDDIVTTGTTIEKFATAIKEYNKELQVRGLCVARHTI